MKGLIIVTLDDEVSIYVKASNLQGEMEGTIKRKSWNELLNKEIEIETCRSTTVKSYDIISDKILKIKIEMRKDTGIYNKWKAFEGHLSRKQHRLLISCSGVITTYFCCVSYRG